MKFEPIKPAPPVTSMFIGRIPGRSIRWLGPQEGSSYWLQPLPRDCWHGEEGIEGPGICPPALQHLVGKRGFDSVKSAQGRSSPAEFGSAKKLACSQGAA